MRPILAVLSLAFAVAVPAVAQVASFDTQRCDSGDTRNLSDAHVAFCRGYRGGIEACKPAPLERKEVTDACQSGATMHSQSRIRDYTGGGGGPPAARAPATAAAARPSPEVCKRTMIDQIGLASADEVRQALAPRYQEIVVGTAPESWNMRLEARRSGCDDPRVSAVFYDFDAKGILREVTYVWLRPAGAAPNPIFRERAAALAKSHRLPAPQSPTRLEGGSKLASILLQDVADRNVVLEAYSLPR